MIPCFSSRKSCISLYTCSYIILFFGVWFEERFGDKFACSRENMGYGSRNWRPVCHQQEEHRVWFEEKFGGGKNTDWRKNCLRQGVADNRKYNDGWELDQHYSMYSDFETRNQHQCSLSLLSVNPISLALKNSMVLMTGIYLYLLFVSTWNVSNFITTKIHCDDNCDPLLPPLATLSDARPTQSQIVSTQRSAWKSGRKSQLYWYWPTYIGSLSKSKGCRHQCCFSVAVRVLV